MVTDKRDYGGETAQQRAARRRAVLLDAAVGLLAEGGRHGLRVDAVCAAAGLSKRYFYESFADLDALVAAALARLGEDAVAAALAALGDATGEGGGRRAVAGFVHHLTDDPRRARVLLGAVAVGDAAAAPRAAALRAMVRIVAERGGGLYDAPADPRIDLAAAVLVGGTGQAVLDWLDGGVDLTREALVESLVATWLAVAAETVGRVRTDPGPARRS